MRKPTKKNITPIPLEHLDRQTTIINLQQNPAFKKQHTLSVTLTYDNGTVDNYITLDGNRWCVWGGNFDPHVDEIPGWLDEELKPHYVRIIELAFKIIFTFEKFMKKETAPKQKRNKQ